jgi:GNAT superfamily N-acetyltransferase
VSEIELLHAGAAVVRAVQRRRRCDETSLRLALELADRGGAWVACDQSEAIGLVLALMVQDACSVGDLYVEPSYRDRDIAARLLGAAFDRAGDRARSMLLPLEDSAAMALALNHGLVPRETLLHFAGAIPREAQLVQMAAGAYRFAVEPLDRIAHRAAVDALDRETRATARPELHRELSSAASGYAFLLDNELVAYAYVWPDGRIGPLAGASGAYAVQLFAYALHALQRQYRASWCTALVPASNGRTARAALRSGLRIERTWPYACDAPPPDLSRCIGFHRLVF